jgi:molybdenum cofactor biosynthesis enzyme MoaA
VNTSDLSTAFRPDNALDFLWIELTNRCNLECVHCYAGSSPHGDDCSLSPGDHATLLADAHALGCRQVQFIGGEPTLNRTLPSLIRLASDLGYELIEVYTNLVALSDALIECFVRHHVRIATSVYANDPVLHDRITTREGSWLRTTANIRRVLSEGLTLRASIIEMETNRGCTEATKAWLHEMGVTEIGTDRLRQFGRAASASQKGSDQGCELGELCGNCAHGTLCVGPDGAVAPCIMSKPWTVGSLQHETLASIVNSETLRGTRQAIYEQTVAHRELAMGGCQPDSRNPCGPDCGPNSLCSPCSPKGHCGPNSCQPNR